MLTCLWRTGMALLGTSGSLALSQLVCSLPSSLCPATQKTRTKIASSSASFPFKDLSCFHALFAACLQASSSSQKVLLHALCVANHMRKHLSPCRSIICVAIWWLPVMATRQPLLTGATALCTRVRCIRLHDTVVTGHH